MVDEELLHGGVANAGSVIRQGAHVLRPSNPHSASIHAALNAVRAAGFGGVPQPIGIERDNRERLEFIPGGVPLPPYPAWARTDDALASVAGLLRQFHDASTDLDLTTGSWSDELADPNAVQSTGPDIERDTGVVDCATSDDVHGLVWCHNDVCLENVVFQDGQAVALLDFDFAAPGSRVFDLGALARMCVPIDDPTNAARLGWVDADLPSRLRLVADSYGFGASERSELIVVLDQQIESGGEFVRRHVEAGHPAFTKMWNEMGGSERFDRRRRWWETHRPAFAATLR